MFEIDKQREIVKINIEDEYKVHFTFDDGETCTVTTGDSVYNNLIFDIVLNSVMETMNATINSEIIERNKFV